jgi:hypothetical protein
MQTISEDEFKKRYGEVGHSQFNQPQPSQGPNFGQRIKQAASQGIDMIKSSNADINSGNPLRFMEGAVRAGAGAVETAFSPVTAAIEPVTKPTIGKAVNYAADKISNNPEVQKFAASKAGELMSRIVEDLNNLNTIAGVVVGSESAAKLTSKFDSLMSDLREAIPTSVPEAATSAAKPALTTAKTAIKEISPSYQSIINDQVTKAFDLTQGDVKNISLSTGNHVGDFVAKHDLIGNTVESSQRLLDDFYKQNYKTVRDEISQVKTTYEPSSVPRYTEALQELQKKTTDVPGLQEASTEINALLKKKTIKLEDVQRAKELMDDHFSLYKVTGDVGEGIAKQGLDNIRKDLRKFIEDEVKNNSGTDIRELNNNVATSRSIMDAIKNRATRASTRQKISLGDLGWFTGGSVAGTPLFGIAAVFAKKVLESPTVRLRIAKFVKGLSDAKQVKIKTDLEAGLIPQELQQFVKQKPTSK